MPQGIYRVVLGRERAFTEGGCLLDIDGDGRVDIVVNEGGPEAALVWFRAPGRGTLWVRHVINTGPGGAAEEIVDLGPADGLGRRVGRPEFSSLYTSRTNSARSQYPSCP